ncbi:retrotransposon protein, putative, ty1-copia subclass [Tanacetum coccineum]|uniref:Retrotransposon protein, putative, ty1-copia subclass n=1 Tax=Tanacetum coccineum TaxID=301880 RepID=A0ABQ5DLW9_9ASTR
MVRDVCDLQSKMALPVQNINHSAFRSMFEKEKLSGNNFNDWFARLKLVLKVEKKMHVIEQPLPPAPEAEPNIVPQWTTLYDAHTEIAYLMLGSMTPELHRQFELHYPYDMVQELRSMFEKQVGVEKFDLIQSFHACKQEEGKSVADYVLKMKGYVEQLERLGYMLLQDISVGLILNGLTKDFVGFVRNYNMITWEDNRRRGSKLALPVLRGFRIERKLKQGALYLYVGNGVRAQVEAIRSFDLVLPNGLVICLDNCHYAPTITRGVVSVSRLVDNGFVQCFTDCGISVSKNGVLYFNDVPRNGIYEIDMHDLVPNVNSIYNVSNKRVKHNLDSTYLWHCRLAHINKKRIKQLQQDGLLKSTDDESFDKCESCLSGQDDKENLSYYLLSIHTTTYGVFERRNALCLYGATRDTPDKLEQRSVKCIFIGYPKETMGYYFYFPPENKIVVARYAKFFEKRLISQEISRRAVDLEEIQEEEDTTPSEITSNIPQEVEGFEPPQEEVIPIRRSERTHRAPNRLCLNVEVEEHSLGDLNEPTSYKAAMLDLESNK